MKILAVSDVVNRKLYSPYVKEFAGDIDIIVSCGDLPIYYLDFLVSNLCKPLLYICGNHDHYIEPGMNAAVPLLYGTGQVFSAFNFRESFGGKNLDKVVTDINRVRFAGLEGSRVYNYGEHQYSEMQMKFRAAALGSKLWFGETFLKQKLDVLITHSPPRGIHDLDDLAHQGFETFLHFIKKHRPRYLLHGHTHLYDNNASRIAEYYGTKIVNCYDYQIINLDSD